MLAAVLFTSGAAAETIGFAVNSDDQREADRLLSIDLDTGQARIVGELPNLLEDVEGVAFDENGTLFGVDSATRTLVRVNAESGAAQSVDGRAGNLGFAPTAAYDFGLTFTCSGELLLTAEQTQSLYMVDPESGAARLMGESGGLGDAMTALAAWGENIYALAAGGNFYRVDKMAGTASLVGRIDAFEITDGGLAFDADGGLWAITSDFSFDDSRIFRIDPATAGIQEIARTRAGIESLAITGPGGCEPKGTAPVPVPAGGPLGWLILVAGCAAVAWRRRALLVT
ncbi:MAG: hypothetical protein AAGE01_00890 [Pseudomonadota bacterium]